jgi:formyl-CoA transferase
LEKALADVRVLDMTFAQSGPSCTQLLAWLGADVVKLESPGGDASRKQLRDIPALDSLYFAMLNCNKRSITLSLRSVEGQRLLGELLPRFDVLVENFAPGATHRMGLDWEALQRIHPRLIHASIRACTEGDPVQYKAYDGIAQAIGGAMSATCPHGERVAPTVAQIGDAGAGAHLVTGIVAALYQRERTGRGQRVTVALQHAVLSLCRSKVRDHQIAHREPPRHDRAGGAPRSYVRRTTGGAQPGGAVRCAPGGADDYIYVVIPPASWEPLARLIGRPELLTDPQWGTPAARRDSWDTVFPFLQEWAAHRDKWQARSALTSREIPCGPVFSIDDLLNDAALADAEMIVRVPHPERGEFATVGCPIKLSDSYVDVARSPLLGEHNVSVYGDELGLHAQIPALKAKGVI